MGSKARRGLRVVHVPARTPYVWKLHGPDFHILNGAELGNDIVPATVDSRWLLAHRPLTWLDVVHLHHVEFEDVAALEELLDACATDSVRVVLTAHDLHPMFTTAEAYVERLRLLATADIGWVLLTRASAGTLANVLGATPAAHVIPHGYVVPPEALDGRDRTHHEQIRHLMYGAPRPNRDHLTTLINWSLSTTEPQARLNLVLRALSPVDVTSPDSRAPELIAAVRADPRIQVTMRPYPSDEEITAAGVRSDALLLPYLWGTHSGQLEFAFDLNLLAISSSVGHLRDQYEQHKGRVREPEWFDWSSGNPYLHGERFLAALERANARLAAPTSAIDADFLEYRRQEHQRILQAYARVYGGDL